MKETKMSSNVDKIVGDIIEKFRPIVRNAVQQADADARGELLATFTKAIGSAPKATAAQPEKRKVGRPRKNPVPEAVQSTSGEAKPKKAKQKRVISDDVRKKLTENLSANKDVKADKAKPEKRPVGRPRKVKPVEAAPVAAAAEAF